MLDHRYSKHRLGVLVAGVALATWGLFGIFGTASAVAGKPPPAPPPPANPAIAFQNFGGIGLGVCNADGSNATIIAPSLPPFANIAWSPNGGSVAMSAFVGGSYLVWIIDVSVVNGVPVGGNLRSIPGTERAQYVAWSPAGDQIAFTRSVIPSFTLELISTSGGTPEVLLTDSSCLGPIAWSPTADRLVYSLTRQGPEYLYSDFWVRDMASGVSTHVYQAPYVVMSIDWGRTADVLAYTHDYKSGKNWVNSVWTFDMATGQPTLVKYPLAPGSTISFSPDDTKIALVLIGHGGNSRVLNVLDLATGGTTPILNNVLRVGWRRNP